MNAIACESGCIFLFENMFIFILKLKIMNIFRSDKIEIEYDSREREFTVTMYDKYGHYIDSTKIDMDDMKALYESLNKIKNLF